MTDSLKSRSPDELIKEIERLRAENEKLSHERTLAETWSVVQNNRAQGYEKLQRAYERLKDACMFYANSFRDSKDEPGGALGQIAKAALREADEILKETK